jgi:uncharacterized membrane protein HdeD (DUF308 family)
MNPTNIIGERNESIMSNNMEKQLANTLARNWWKLLVRGVAAILFGVLVWLLPGISLTLLVLSFGVFVVVDGILGAWVAFSGRKEYENWWELLLWGLVGIGVGILTFVSPGVTAVALVIFIAVWAIATGVLQIVVAIRLRREIEGEWLLILGGLASVVLGILFMLQPGTGALALVWLIGTYAIVFGLLLAMLAFKMRSFRKVAYPDSQN